MQTVGQIITKSLIVLRKHPLLALPVIAADLLGFAAMHIQHALHQPLFAFVFGNKDSVLTTTRSSFVLTPENASKAALLTVPVIWGCYFLSVLLYTTALLVTSALLDQIEMNDEDLDLRSAVVRAFKDKKRLLLFSISMIGALAVAAILTGLLISGSMQIPWLAEKMGRDFGYFVAFPLQLVIALLFTRPALKLLRESQVLPAQGLSRTAVFLGFSVTTAQIAYLLLLEHAALNVLFQQKTVVAYLIREAVVSLIGASFYIVFFIGLSLLAASDRQISNPEDPGPVDGLYPLSPS
jgi:hypothetical protein